MSEKINDDAIRKAILNRFIDNFIKKDLFFEGGTENKRLLWCFFREERINVYPTEVLAEIKLPSIEDLFFYNERTEELFKMSFTDVCEFVKGLEPWEEIDAVIFDETMSWVVAITHEDFSITIGLEN